MDYIRLNREMKTILSFLYLHDRVLKKFCVRTGTDLVIFVTIKIYSGLRYIDPNWSRCARLKEISLDLRVCLMWLFFI
jgi:hypothetical protein